jgi:hypothetical protein
MSNKIQRNKLSICLSLNGRILAEIDLSPMEFEDIRYLSLEAAVSRMIKKKPFLGGNHAFVSLIVNQIRSGNFQLRDAGKTK